MEKVKANLFLQFVAIPVFLIGDFVIGRYYPTWPFQVYPAHWACIILLLLFSFFPFARKALVVSSEEKPRFKCWQWLALIWVFELSIMAIFAGLVQLLKQMQPELEFNFNLLNSTWVETWGLFPWALMTTLACLIAYYAYLKNKDASMSTLMFPVFRSSASETLGITANMCARLNTSVAIVSSLMIATLALASLGVKLIGVEVSQGLNIENIIILTLILIIVGHHKLGARLFETLLKKKVSVFAVLMLAMSLMAILLVLNSWILNRIETHSVSLPEWLVRDAPIAAIYHLFLAVWILSWCSLGGVFIAYVSRGYTMVQLIMASLILPILGFLLADYLSTIPPGLIVLASLVGCVVLLYLVSLNKTTLNMLMQAYVAANDQVKQRAHGLFVLNWIRMSMGLLYLYLPGGILLMGLFTIMYTVPSFIYFLLAVLASGLWVLRFR